MQGLYFITVMTDYHTFLEKLIIPFHAEIFISELLPRRVKLQKKKKKKSHLIKKDGALKRKSSKCLGM